MNRIEEKKEPPVRTWQRVMDSLMEETGRDLRWVSEYIGAAYNPAGVSFYVKVPKKRSVLIGIGMAFGQSLAVINDWIVRFGNKRRLYPKDVTEDLIWIYLIQAGEKDRDSGRNYFRMYEECSGRVLSIYNELWNEIAEEGEDTESVGVSLSEVEHDEAFEGLGEFVAEHLNSFKTAYARPRRYLDGFVDVILQAFREAEEVPFYYLSDLRGWLDDSMINYLSGDSETINVIDLKTGRKTKRIKHVPKERKTHISMGLSVGMSREELNEYLGMMGYGPLDPRDKTEGLLGKALDLWKRAHPDVSMLKAASFGGAKGGDPGAGARDPVKAAEDMLQLRQELWVWFERAGQAFPY